MYVHGSNVYLASVTTVHIGVATSEPPALSCLMIHAGFMCVTYKMANIIEAYA